MIKTYDPISGTCFKVKVYRFNELSRIWSALGPRGVSITKKGVDSIRHQKGVASIMSDVEFAAPVAEADSGTATPTKGQAQASAQASTSQPKKKKRAKRNE